MRYTTIRCMKFQTLNSVAPGQTFEASLPSYRCRLRLRCDSGLVYAARIGTQLFAAVFDTTSPQQSREWTWYFDPKENGTDFVLALTSPAPNVPGVAFLYIDREEKS